MDSKILTVILIDGLPTRVHGFGIPFEHLGLIGYKSLGLGANGILEFRG